jgi:multiple sugar transport system ATP-binding protein
LIEIGEEMAEIALVGVCKVFENGVRALVDCDLAVAKGEWLVLVGPSGCGKTTTLRLIAGLEEPTAGTIRIGGAIVNQVPPAQRDVAMVFQRPALFPNKDVRGNLGFGLRIRGGFFGRFSRTRQAWEEQAIQEVACCLRIHHLLDRVPAELSGGEQQRVALGRALVRPSAVGLLDEPLGHLDAPLRLKLRRELPLLRSRFPATMVIVTHDPAEALAFGDRVAVLQEGRVLQVDSPEKIRREPSNAFVAEFFQDAL